MANQSSENDPLVQLLRQLENRMIEAELDRVIQKLLKLDDGLIEDDPSDEMLRELLDAAEKPGVVGTMQRESLLDPIQRLLLWEGRNAMAEKALLFLQAHHDILEKGNTDENGNHSPEFWKEVPPYPREIYELIRAENFNIIDESNQEGELFYVAALCATEKGDTVIAIERIETADTIAQGGALLACDFWAWDDQAINR